MRPPEETAPARADIAQSPLLSVVVPTRDRPEFVRDLLAALARSTLTRLEVHLMDQSVDDAARSVLLEFADPRFIYHRMARPGACPARNLGAALANAPLVAFTDDDCAPPPDWPRRIVDAFEADEDLQFVFGALDPAPCDYAVGSVPSFTPDPAMQRGPLRRQLMTAAAGANMSCRKSFLRRCGGFDELLGPDAPWVRNNDTSICYKVLRSRVKWEMRPDIRTTHLNGFRPWPQIWDIYRAQMFGSGVNYARFVRRGDVYAAWLFSLEFGDMMARPLRAMARFHRPDGAGYTLQYLRGFLAGIRLAGRIGYVDGDAITRMERTRVLDAAAAGSFALRDQAP